MNDLTTELDHLVVVASRLGEGVEFCEKLLGVQLTKGGEHVRVGTHNYLLNLGEAIYLEVIAVNPRAGAVSTRRWFGMDDPVQRDKARRGPFLATFVARTTDIVRATEVLPDLGTACDMERGALRWRISLRADGALIENGVMPTVIQWPQGLHPTQALPDSGCRLVALDVFHPEPTRIEAEWRRIGLHTSDRIAIQKAEQGAAPRLVARLETPSGIKTLT